MQVKRRSFISVLFFGLLWGAGGFAQAQPIRVVTTIPDLADITKQIGKELVDVESLTRGVEFMHAVPVKPSFVPKLNRANILVAMGLDLEISWLPALLEPASNPKIMPGQPGHVDCSVGINVLDVPKSVDRAEGDVHPKGNPHYNLDPFNGKVIARNIADGLARNFPQHKAVFEKNLTAYLAELEKAIARWQTLAAPLKGTKFVAYHQRLGLFRQSLRPATGRQHRSEARHRTDAESFGGSCPENAAGKSAGDHLRAAKRSLSEAARRSDRAPTVVRLQSTGGATAETDSYIKFIDYNVRSLLAALKKS